MRTCHTSLALPLRKCFPNKMPRQQGLLCGASGGGPGWAPCSSCVWKFPTGHFSTLCWGQGPLPLVPRGLSPPLLTQPHFFKKLR